MMLRTITMLLGNTTGLLVVLKRSIMSAGVAKVQRQRIGAGAETVASLIGDYPLSVGLVVRACCPVHWSRRGSSLIYRAMCIYGKNGRYVVLPDGQAV